MINLPTQMIYPADYPGEVISVRGCRPGHIQLGEGEDMVCIDPNDPWDGQDGGDGPPGQPGEPPGGPQSSPPPPPPPHPHPTDVARKTRCKACKNNAQACLAQAILGQQTCTDNAAMMASSFCNVGGDDAGAGVTAWGCNVYDLLKGTCPQAESPWQNKKNWEYSCAPSGGHYSCSGPGVSNCLNSWRVNHPNGTITVGSSGQLSATFKGVGGQQTQTFTESYTWNGSTGYAMACTSAALNLANSCTAMQNKCQADNDCTAADLQ